MSNKKITKDALTDKELSWLQLQRGLACELVKIFYNPAFIEPVVIEQLHGTYDAYLKHFLNPPRKGFLRKKSLTIDPNAFVLSIGVALGDCIVAQTTLEWMIITDDYGTDMGLYAAGKPDQYSDIVTHPMNMVAKRLENRTSGWIIDTYSSLLAEIQRMQDDV